jgi:hypothetical protein
MKYDYGRIVTDAGVTLHFGRDYGVPWSVDPINGVDVSLGTSQGVNQLGSTVESQNISGVSRTISGAFLYGDGQAQRYINALPFQTGGTLYLFNKYFTRFYVKKTPYVVATGNKITFEMMIYCERPYWYSLTETSVRINGYYPAFTLPVDYSTPHQFGAAASGGFVNVPNSGAFRAPFTGTLYFKQDCASPIVTNVLTGDFFKLNTSFSAGQRVEIYRDLHDRVAVKLVDGTAESNLFWALDEDSTLFELAVGDNPLTLDSDQGNEVVEMVVAFYAIYPGVMLCDQ